MRDEVGEQQASLSTRQVPRHVHPRDPHDEGTAQLDPGRDRIGHARATLAPMGHVIVCECGTVVRGDDERELLGRAHGHMQSNHPAIAGRITDEQLLALSQEEPPRRDLER